MERRIGRVGWWCRAMLAQCLSLAGVTCADGGEGGIPVSHAVLVHGIWQSEFSGLVVLRGALERRGVKCVMPSLKPLDARDGLEPLARQLKDEVERQFGPRQRFVIIGFSMGGLISRLYLQELGGASRCDGLITISTPHHGTRMAALHYGKGAAEMRPESGLLRRLRETEDRLGGMPVVSYRTPMDMVIVPSESSVWERAVNVEVPCPLHPLMTVSPSLHADLWKRLSPGEASGMGDGRASRR